MTEEKKPTAAGTEVEQTGEELSEKSLKGIAGGGNPFTVTGQNGNVINLTHGELPEGFPLEIL